MESAATVVRSFFERMEAREWDAAGSLIAPAAEISWPATGERFSGTSFVAMNRAYPDGWALEVIEVLSSGDSVAAQVRVDQGKPSGVAASTRLPTVSSSRVSNTG